MSDKPCIPLFSLKTQEKMHASLLAGREEGMLEGKLIWRKMCMLSKVNYQL